EQGQQCFIDMSEDMERNYQRILEQFGEERLQQLLGLLNELKNVKP
ncbi:homoprotocatechuate degradation operon regulator HpaR, partial [Pseudomonas sp. MAFF212428]|nr:homoprotocatechuate degradation operon regulator HpaR [Pseudomonas brassicae]